MLVARCPLRDACVLPTVPTALTIWIVSLSLAVYPVCYPAHYDTEQDDVYVDPKECGAHHQSNSTAMNCNPTAMINAVSITSIPQAHAHAKAKVVAMRLYHLRFPIQWGGKENRII